MAFTQEQIEKAIATVIGAFGRFDSYEWDEDNDKLTANFKSNSGRTDRQVFIDFDKDEDDEYTGDMTISQSEYYPRDSAGWGLSDQITDALENPEEYELFDYEDKRIYPNTDDDKYTDSNGSSSNIAWIVGAITIVAGIGAGIWQGIKYIRRRKNNESTEETTEKMEKDSAVEVLQSTSKTAGYLINNLGDKYEGEITQDHFEKTVQEAKEIDPRFTFLWVRENKDRFTFEMITYIETLYGKEI